MGKFIIHYKYSNRNRSPYCNNDDDDEKKLNRKKDEVDILIIIF